MSETNETYDNGGQYSRHSILRYETIFGDGFVSTGGLPVVEYFCERLSLSANPKILDIGSGLGGAAFYLAERYGAEVTGLDLAPEMVAIANERAAVSSNDISFRLADALAIDLPAGHFDLIWSRDALLHVADKQALFARCFGWLAPGGQIMISDYSCTPAPHGEAFQAYVEKSGYHLVDVEAYGGLLRDAGFSVEIEDWTPRFIEILGMEMETLRSKQETFLKDFSQEDLDYLLARWQSKIDYCRADDMRVGLWHGKK
jgi:phosphoethanolamine N-methyltransferase